MASDLVGSLIGAGSGIIGGLLGMSAQDKAAQQQARYYSQMIKMYKQAMGMAQDEMGDWAGNRDAAMANITNTQSGRYGALPLYQQAMKSLTNSVNAGQKSIKRNMALTGNARSGNYYKQNEQEMRGAGMDSISQMMAGMSQSADNTSLDAYGKAFNMIPGLMQNLGNAYGGQPVTAGQGTMGFSQLINSLGNGASSYIFNQNANARSDKFQQDMLDAINGGGREET